jgi:Rps23 Pro-64 3,4-dihydroxylase Tpa1-like proline 4-hydroxylase
VISQETLVRGIVERLGTEAAELARRFATPPAGSPTRCLVVDNLLPDEIARGFYPCFPPRERMRRLSSFRERKFTFKQLDEVPDLLKHVTLAIQTPEVVAAVERITGMRRQVPDARLYAGGITLMAQGDFLNPHIDNSHDSERRLYRTLNLLYYVTPGWKPEFGGNLELWDDAVSKPVTFPAEFNRLLIMETNRRSWHSVSPVRHDGQRCCVSNYYFSEQPPEGTEDYFHVTSFSARPEQTLRRWVAAADNLARMGIRRIFRKGIGKKDVYRPRGPT